MRAKISHYLYLNTVSIGIHILFKDIHRENIFVFFIQKLF